MTVAISSAILKELETHFKMIFGMLKSDEIPVSDTILKKADKSEISAELYLKFPCKNEVYSVGVCTKFLYQTMVIFLKILKEFETNFKVRYDMLKSEDGPLSYSMFKKGHKSKIPAELLNRQTDKFQLDGISKVGPLNKNNLASVINRQYVYLNLLVTNQRLMYYLITTRGTVMFFASLASSWSPTILSSSNQEYLSIRQTDSRGTCIYDQS